MAVGDRFDFGAVDVLATTQDHVFLAVHDKDEAILVDTRNIAGVQPAIGDRFSGGFRAVDIALDDGRPFDPEFTEFAGCDRVAKLIHAFDFEVRHRRAGTVRLVDEEVSGHGRDDPACLRHAVTGGGTGR